MLAHAHRLAKALDARPAEVVGLSVLLVGGLVATVVLVAASSSTDLPAFETEAPALLVEQVDVLIHVAGAVRQPGVVRLPAGSRVADAIAAAGGARVDAVVDALNLAALVEDGERIVVPTATEAPVAHADAVVDADGRLDLNRATADDLDGLPGIGPVLASRVIAWRDQHGPFREVGQLREVPGIGERTFQALADLVRV